SFLADFGLPVSVTGFLGEDNPHLFERLFARKGIKDRFVRIPGSTRTGIKIIDEINRTTTDVNFPGLPPRPQDIEALFRVVDELSEVCEWFVLSGSIPAGVSEDIYQRLIVRIKSNGKSVALDTSGEGLRQALSVKPDLVKPNVYELEEILQRSLTSSELIEQAAAALNQQGIQTVVISMGEQGAVFVQSGEVVIAQPPPVAVKSTVGAGDAMIAGTIAGLIRGDSLADCARLATAFSISAISRVGAGLPSQDTIGSYRKQVKIQRLNRSI
ncbi:MAG: 1-phosphofructokinase family hexose kinase, partial [Chloroflexi bacterium]|nr:1-phosphofructokinase family hexose kinase [Chloroflexota bacterium]